MSLYGFVALYAPGVACRSNQLIYRRPPPPCIAEAGSHIRQALWPVLTIDGFVQGFSADAIGKAIVLLYLNGEGRHAASMRSRFSKEESCGWCCIASVSGWSMVPGYLNGCSATQYEARPGIKETTCKPPSAASLATGKRRQSARKPGACYFVAAAGLLGKAASELLA